MPDYYQSPYSSDCKRIQGVALAHNYIVSESQAEDIWNEVSESFASGWLNLPEADDDLWYDIEPFLVGKYPRICTT